MKIDWDHVKKTTLWPYEELIEKIIQVLEYGFVQEHYNHTMKEAIVYSERLQSGYLLNGREAAHISKITENLKTLYKLNIGRYQDLVQQVDTKQKCVTFLKKKTLEEGGK